MYRLRCKFCGMWLEPEEVCRCHGAIAKRKQAGRRHLASLLNGKGIPNVCTDSITR